VAKESTQIRKLLGLMDRERGIHKSKSCEKSKEKLKSQASRIEKKTAGNEIKL